MLECPNSIEELEELERLLPLCRTDLYAQAKARIETGAARGIKDVSRQIGQEINRNPDSIRRAIQREQQTRGATVSPLTSQFRTSFTGDNNWYTPIKYIELVRECLGSIDIDPATSEFGQQRIKAKTYYTIENDGLKHEWHGRLWLNPPYAQPLIVQFIEKAVVEFKAGRVIEAIILTHNFTDTYWFHHAESVCSAICFTRGRINYEKADGPKAQPTQGSAFFYLGKNKERFIKSFNQFGCILRPQERGVRHD